MSNEQVLTSIAGTAAVESGLDQTLEPLAFIAESVLGTILVHRQLDAPSKPADAARQQSGVGWQGTDANPYLPRRGKSRAGGWPSSPSLCWGDVKRIAALAHEAERRGLRFTP